MSDTVVWLRKDGVRERIGLIDRTFQIALILAYGAFVAGCGWYFYTTGQNNPSTAVIMAIAGTAIVAIVSGMVVFAGLIGFLAANEAIRALCGGLLVAWLLYTHQNSFYVALAGIFTVLIVLGRFRRPKAIHDHLQARKAAEREAEASKPTVSIREVSRPRPVPPVVLNDHLPEDKRQGLPPSGYSGRWGDIEYAMGLRVGEYILLEWSVDMESQRQFDMAKQKGETPLSLPRMRMKVRYKPDPTPAYPFGFYYNSTEDQFMPYLHDPWESPAPRPAEEREPSTVYGDNHPLSQKERYVMGASHPMPKKP